MRVSATAKYIRRSTRKTRLVTQAIVGRPVEEASAILQFMPQGAARDVAKVLKSATANAENNHDLPADELFVAEATATPGLKYLAPFAGCAIAEYWMLRGHDTLIVYDDLTQQIEQAGEGLKLKLEDVDAGVLVELDADHGVVAQHRPARVYHHLQQRQRLVPVHLQHPVSELRRVVARVDQEQHQIGLVERISHGFTGSESPGEVNSVGDADTLGQRLQPTAAAAVADGTPAAQPTPLAAVKDWPLKAA